MQRIRLAALAVVVVASFGGELVAQQNAIPKVGDHLIIALTGDLATEYARRIRSQGNPPAGLQIETFATVVQKLDDGRIRIEHSTPVIAKGKPIRLITLTATVDATHVATQVIPKGTSAYASPGAHKAGEEPELTREESVQYRLNLSSLKGLKLRTWTLAEEIGDAT